jgi:hypothetical protein
MIDYIKALFGSYTPGEPVQSLLEHAMDTGDFNNENDFAFECYGINLYLLARDSYNMSSVSRFQLRERFNFTGAEIYWLESKLQDHVIFRVSERRMARRRKLNDWLQKQK